jgi:hypothetical protein
MLLPQLAADNFTRANENPLSDGGNWTQFASTAIFGTAKLVSNNAEAASLTNADMVWTGATWPADHWSEVTAAATNASYIGACVRVNIGAFTSYRLYWQGTLGGSGTLTIQKWNAGTATVLVTTSATVNVGDKIRAVALGSWLFLLLNGIQQLAVKDTSFATGSAGLIITPVTAITDTRLSGWSGGIVLQQGRTTLFSDNFTRANENPLSDGGKWSTMIEVAGASSPAQVLSNLMEATTVSTRNGGFVNSTGIAGTPNDQWAELTMGANAGLGTVVLGPCVRMLSGATWNYVRALYNNGIYNFQRGQTGGVFTTFGSTSGAPSPLSGDVLRVEVAGTLYTMFYNNIAVMVSNDSALTSGAIGFSFNPQAALANAKFSLFRGGSFEYPNQLMLQGLGT